MNTRISGRFAVKTLEFDKVKQNVAEKAATEQGKDRLLGLPVSSDFETFNVRKRRIKRIFNIYFF